MTGSEAPGARHERGWRLRALNDAQLADLVLADPDGPEWEVLRESLAAYVLPRFSRWAQAGQLRAKAIGNKTLGAGKIPPDLHLSHEQADALVCEVVAVAIRAFPSQALPKWEPGRGRSLRSYFVSWCLMKLPDAYQQWHRREVAQGVALVPVDEMVSLSGTDPTPDDIVAMREALADHAFDDPLGYRILELRLEGYTYSAIGELLGSEEPLMNAKRARSRHLRFLQSARARSPAE